MTYSLFDRRDSFYSDTNSIFDKNFDDLLLLGAKGKVIASRAHTDILCDGSSFYDTLSKDDRDFLISSLNLYERHLMLLDSSLGVCIVIPSMFAATRTFLVSIPSVSYIALATVIRSGLFGLVSVAPSLASRRDVGTPTEDEISAAETYCRRLISAYGTLNFEYLAEKTVAQAANILGERALAISDYIGCVCRVFLTDSLSQSRPKERIDAYVTLGFIGAAAFFLRNASSARDMEITFDEGPEGLLVSISARLHRPYADTNSPPLSQLSRVAGRMRIIFEHHEETVGSDCVFKLRFCPVRKDFSLLGIKVEPSLDSPEEQEYNDEF